jgi:hypothetical protein
MLAELILQFSALHFCSSKEERKEREREEERKEKKNGFSSRLLGLFHAIKS